MIVANNGKFRVELEWIGEGIEGDYDKSDPNDTPLLRFTTFRLAKGAGSEGDGWDVIPDGSYCCQIPDTASEDVKRRAAEMILAGIVEDSANGHSLKRICERYSWLALDDKGEVVLPLPKLEKNTLVAFPPPGKSP